MRAKVCLVFKENTILNIVTASTMWQQYNQVNYTCFAACLGNLLVLQRLYLRLKPTLF